MKKLPISALVASRNEGHYLEDCLKSLQFCDEIYGVDIDSTDDSLAIFQKYAHKVERFHPVPLIEMLHPVFIPKLKNDWILLTDPDERVTPELVESISEMLQSITPDVSVLRAPTLKYFKNKPLRGTCNGGVIHSRLLYKRSGINIDDDVHKGIKLKPGYERLKIPFNGSNLVVHLWCDSWRQMIDKHNRYTKGEGQAMYNQGLRYSPYNHLKATLVGFYFNFKTLKGYLDGWRGFVISILQARYEFLAWKSLKKFQKSKG